MRRSGAFTVPHSAIRRSRRGRRDSLDWPIDAIPRFSSRRTRVNGRLVMRAHSSLLQGAGDVDDGLALKRRPEGLDLVKDAILVPHQVIKRLARAVVAFDEGGLDVRVKVYSATRGARWVDRYGGW